MTPTSQVIPIEAILFRRLSFTDWRAINGLLGRPGGGGERHIALDKIAQDSKTSRFFQTTHSPQVIDVTAIGGSQETKQIVFKDWGGGRNQWTASDQFNNRHPAVSPAYGFPNYEDSDLWTGTAHSQSEWAEKVVVYWVRCTDHRYYMGFVAGAEKTQNWAKAFNAFYGGSKKLDLIEVKQMSSLSTLAQKIIEALNNGHHNILLSGPPGTGKTIVMNEVRDFLTNTNAATNIGLNPSDGVEPFQPIGISNPLPEPIYTDWMTFHQSTTYEEFIVGLRPVPVAKSGITLQPRAGRLLEAIKAIESGTAQSSVLFIDEFNRGNPAQVFGEMITFLEKDKRSTEIYLQGVNDSAGNKTEDIAFRGGLYKLNYPLKIPESIYVIASINSLDRSVAPLDQALARRFHRIHCPPDMSALLKLLNVKKTIAELKTAVPDSAEDNDAGLVAALLLNRINSYIRHLLGSDFEFGHGYLNRVWLTPEGAERWLALAEAWDSKLLPQLEEMFRSRLVEFEKILRVSAAQNGGKVNYPFKMENPPVGLDDAEDLIVYDANPITSLAPDDLRETLVFLSKIIDAELLDRYRNLCR